MDFYEHTYGIGLPFYFLNYLMYSFGSTLTIILAIFPCIFTSIIIYKSYLMNDPVIKYVAKYIPSVVYIMYEKIIY